MEQGISLLSALFHYCLMQANTCTAGEKEKNALGYPSPCPPYPSTSLRAGKRGEQERWLE